MSEIKVISGVLLATFGLLLSLGSQVLEASGSKGTQEQTHSQCFPLRHLGLTDPG